MTKERVVAVEMGPEVLDFVVREVVDESKVAFFDGPREPPPGFFGSVTVAILSLGWRE